jgi:ferredoxin-NADP reductase
MFTQKPSHAMTLPQSQQRIPALSRLWRHRLWAPLNSVGAWDRLASAVNPLWSVSEPRARVIRLVDEAPGVKSLWLKPNARFKGFRPGQHVLLELEIDGARQGRCFSISNAPRADGLLRLTIKAKPNGPVSRAAHQLQEGQVVRLSQAQGDFAPRNASSKLLLLSAGSGITPMLSLLHGITAGGAARDVVLLHSAHSFDDFILANELHSCRDGFSRNSLGRPQLQVHLHATQTHGRLDDQQIARYVRDWQEREALLCGPDDYMRMVEKMFASAERSDHLQSESFGRRAAPIDANAAEHAVLYGQPAHEFSARAGKSLLEAAEAAGLQPRFGCRRGICRTCQCLKRSGTVSNLLTGQQSGPGEELIQLCISTAHSAIELSLQGPRT